MKVLVIIFVFCSFRLFAQDTTSVNVNVEVFYADRYCGDDEISDAERKEHQKEQVLPNFTFYAINLTKFATDSLTVFRLTSDSSAKFSDRLGMGDYMLLREISMEKVIGKAPKDKKFVIAGSFLRKLSRKSASRLYMPEETKKTLKVVFWNNCETSGSVEAEKE